MPALENLKPIGWRARIGVIVPLTNTVNEAEFNRLAPAGVSFHFTRSPIHSDPAADGYVALMRDLDQAVGILAACKTDLVAYGCTAGSMACPADLLIAKMEEVAGVGAVSTAGAILAALAALGVRRVGLATPYVAATNAHQIRFLAEHGIEVVAEAGLGLNTSLEGVQKMSRVPPSEVFAHAKSVDRADAEAILICCTDFNSLDVIKALERELGKPVVSSNVCSLWAALRAAGIDDRIEGYGTLLAEH